MSRRASHGKQVSSASSTQLLGQPPFTNAPNRVLPLARLEFNMRDVYPPLTGRSKAIPPAYDTPDEDVYLHGRNIALLSKAAVYAAVRHDLAHRGRRRWPEIHFPTPRRSSSRR